MKSFQNLNWINTTQGTTTSPNFAGNYAIYNTTNKAFIDGAFLNTSTRNPGVTAVVFSNNIQELWGTTTAVPASGLPSGNTPFCKLYFSNNENPSSGDLSVP